MTNIIDEEKLLESIFRPVDVPCLRCGTLVNSLTAKEGWCGKCRTHKDKNVCDPPDSLCDFCASRDVLLLF